MHYFIRAPTIILETQKRMNEKVQIEAAAEATDCTVEIITNGNVYLQSSQQHAGWTLCYECTPTWMLE